jgi:hypothetical protein
MNVVIYLTNAVLIGAILVRVDVIDNDKAPLLYLVFYPMLVVLNLVIGGVLVLFKTAAAKPFLTASKWMAFLFIPLLMVVIYYL